MLVKITLRLCFQPENFNKLWKVVLQLFFMAKQRFRSLITARKLVKVPQSYGPKKGQNVHQKLPMLPGVDLFGEIYNGQYCSRKLKQSVKLPIISRHAPNCWNFVNQSSLLNTTGWMDECKTDVDGGILELYSLDCVKRTFVSFNLNYNKNNLSL